MQTKREVIQTEKVYDALYLSELYFLTPTRLQTLPYFRRKSKSMYGDLIPEDKLIAFLRQTRDSGARFKKIYIVGNAFDTWTTPSIMLWGYNLTSSRAEGLNPYFDLLDELLASNGKKIFVVGNRDSSSFFKSLPSTLIRYLSSRNWEITNRYEDDDTVVVHGYQGHISWLRWWWYVAVAKLCALLTLLSPRWLWETIGSGASTLSYVWYERICAQNRFQDTRERSPNKKMKYLYHLSTHSKSSDKIVVYGYTRQPSRETHLGFVSAGDWVTNNTFVVRSGDIFSAYKYESDTKRCVEQQRLLMVKEPGHRMEVITLK